MQWASVEETGPKNTLIFCKLWKGVATIENDDDVDEDDIHHVL